MYTKQRRLSRNGRSPGLHDLVEKREHQRLRLLLRCRGMTCFRGCRRNSQLPSRKRSAWAYVGSRDCERQRLIARSNVQKVNSASCCRIRKTSSSKSATERFGDRFAEIR